MYLPFLNVFPVYSSSSSSSSGGDLHVPNPLPLLSNHLLSRSLPVSSSSFFSAAIKVVTNANSNTHCTDIVVDAFRPNHFIDTGRKKQKKKMFRFILYDYVEAVSENMFDVYAIGSPIARLASHLKQTLTRNLIYK